MSRDGASSFAGWSFRNGDAVAVRRSLPEEVPIAVTFDGSTLAVMMATPADVLDFACGFALSEGIITSLDAIEEVEHHDHAEGIEARIWLRADRAKALAARRRSMAGPVGCGLCGIDSLTEANRAVPHVGAPGLRVTRAEVDRATEELRVRQPLYARTHATHAAGFLVPGKGIVMVREDVGRHNALDKLIGALLRDKIDPATGAFVMTSRLSVELVQKAAMAGCAMIIAVSAPTAFALRTAEAAGITLVAFARGEGFDLYSHPHRIVDEVSDVA